MTRMTTRWFIRSALHNAVQKERKKKLMTLLTGREISRAVVVFAELMYYAG